MLLPCRLRVPKSAFELLELEALGDLQSTSPADVASVGNSSSEAVSIQRVAEMHDTHSDRSKWLKVGAAAAAGGVVTFLTAGLAAPAIVAGVGSLVGITSASAGAKCSIECKQELWMIAHGRFENIRGHIL